MSPQQQQQQQGLPKCFSKHWPKVQEMDLRTGPPVNTMFPANEDVQSPQPHQDWVPVVVVAQQCGDEEGEEDGDCASKKQPWETDLSTSAGGKKWDVTTTFNSFINMSQNSTVSHSQFNTLIIWWCDQHFVLTGLTDARQTVCWENLPSACKYLPKWRVGWWGSEPEFQLEMMWGNSPCGEDAASPSLKHYEISSIQLLRVGFSSAQPTV